VDAHVQQEISWRDKVLRAFDAAAERRVAGLQHKRKRMRDPSPAMHAHHSTDCWESDSSGDEGAGAPPNIEKTVGICESKETPGCDDSSRNSVSADPFEETVDNSSFTGTVHFFRLHVWYCLTLVFTAEAQPKLMLSLVTFSHAVKSLTQSLSSRRLARMFRWALQQEVRCTCAFMIEWGASLANCADPTELATGDSSTGRHYVLLSCVRFVCPAQRVSTPSHVSRTQANPLDSVGKPTVGRAAPAAG